jgi:hypothetical protein
MVSKKAVKKVEIADESILNLKGKGKAPARGIGFSVSRIEENEETVPVDFGHAPELEREESPKEAVRETGVATAEALIDRHHRPSRFDQEELHKRMENFAEKLEKAVIKVSPNENGNLPSNVAADPKDLIKVKFEKFVQLVATKDFLSILERNKDEDVVLSSNLLTELASAVEEKGEKKSPVIFLVGLALGVIITYLLINR